MMHSGRLFKLLHARQLHRHAIDTTFTQICECPNVVKGNLMARNGFQIARLFSNVSEGASAKDKNSSTVVENGAEALYEKTKNEPNGAETAATPELKVAEDVRKSEAGKSKLQNLLTETQTLLKEKDRAVALAKQQVLTYLAEVENVRGRTRRDADSIKKHAVETFASDLLDMADNLGRAAATVPDSVRNELLATDSSGNAKLLKSLLEGVDMTEKQLMKIFNKFGVQKFDPVGELYNPNQHLAIVEVEDESKEPQTIVNVVKSGYFFNDKLIRPAEVGVVKKRAESK
eukprot:c20285_g1_i1 orf=80-943(+)